MGSLERLALGGSENVSSHPWAMSTCKPRFGKGQSEVGADTFLGRLLWFLAGPSSSGPTPRFWTDTGSLMTVSTCFPHTPAPWSLPPSQQPLRPGGVEFHFETLCVRREGQHRACSVAAARWGCCSYSSGSRAPGLAPPQPSPCCPSAAAELPGLSCSGSPRSRPPPSAARLAAASHSSSSSLRWRTWCLLLFAPHTALPALAQDLANASRRPEDSRRGLFPLHHFAWKWGRGGVAPPPLNAKHHVESGRLPVLCLLLSLHAAGKVARQSCGCAGRLHMLQDSRESWLREETLSKAKQDSADTVGAREPAPVGRQRPKT